MRHAQLLTNLRRINHEDSCLAIERRRAAVKNIKSRRGPSQRGVSKACGELSSRKPHMDKGTHVEGGCGSGFTSRPQTYKLTVAGRGISLPKLCCTYTSTKSHKPKESCLSACDPSNAAAAA